MRRARLSANILIAAAVLLAANLVWEYTGNRLSHSPAAGRRAMSIHMLPYSAEVYAQAGNTLLDQAAGAGNVFDSRALEEGSRLLRRAAALDPSWYGYPERLGQIADLENASDAKDWYAQALARNPHADDIAVEEGNAWLEAGDLDRAMSLYVQALRDDPARVTLADALFQFSPNTLAQLPCQYALQLHIAQLRLEKGDFDPISSTVACALRDKKAVRLGDIWQLFDALLNQGQFKVAHQLWDDLLAAGTIPGLSTAGNLIQDPNFNRLDINGGFTWRWQEQPHVDINESTLSCHQTASCLQVRFDGSGNDLLTEPWQFVEVEPDSVYRINVWARSDGLNTSSGLRLRADDVDASAATAVSSSDVHDPGDWQPLSLELTTGPHTRLAEVGLLRRPSGEAADEVRGSVWLSEFSMVKVGAASKSSN